MQSPKTAIIIGASSGIGEALANEMIGRGYRVALTARRLEPLQAIQKKAPDQVIIQRMDITDFDTARKGLVDIFKEYDKVDYIYLNAGTITHSGDWTDIHNLLNVNVVGFTALAAMALELFKTQGHGHIAGLSSISAVRGVPTMPEYAASKAYVSHYLAGLRMRLMKKYKRIYITDIQPGYIKTAMTENAPGLFWVQPVKKAARQMVHAVERRKKQVQITRRWKVVAFIMRNAPEWLYRRTV